MKPSRLRRHLGVACAWVAGLLAALTLTAGLLDLAAQRLMHREAEATGARWARLLSVAVPNLDLLLEDREVDGATHAKLIELRNLGEVLRFKVFDRHGQLIIDSWSLDRSNPVAGTGQSVNADVSSEVLNGRVLSELIDGRGKENLPALFSETYLPITVAGQVRGVVEVYLDQTERRHRVYSAFYLVAAAVGAVLLVVGTVIGWLWWARVREREEAQSHVRYLVEHDLLSGALNRNGFNDMLADAARRRARGGPSFAVLCIDLDRFKEVNDSLGHAAGDEVLRQAGARLRSLVRAGDVVARLGGDEFAILQTGSPDAEGVATLGQRIVESLGQRFEIAGQRVVCGASVGAARFGIDAQGIEDLLHKADVAMYRAKTSGRGCFSFYDAVLDRQLEARRALARDLRAALANGGLSLHYQPLFEMDGKRLVGYEALMRWKHPRRGMVSPSEFIPLAEETAQIEALGEWALHRACTDAVTWPSGLRVSVNLSAAQFRGEKDLVQVVARALDASGLEAHRLELEITESLLMHHTDAAVRTLTALSALGVRIAMDDFGTGYSSLAYLWRFPFDKVKIDRAFTQGLGDDKKVALIVRSIVSLAHSMGIRVNAEGVETSHQMAILEKLGCDELQGFLLGRPSPAELLDHADVADPTASPTTLPADPAWSALTTLPAPY